MHDIAIPQLMFITDRHRACLQLPDLAVAAVKGGVDAVQVREKDLSSDELMELVAAVRNAVGGAAPILVNGNLDVALHLGIGLHLPEHSMSVAEARRSLPAHTLIGRSVHDQHSAASESTADYLIAGNVYPTPSKAGVGALGLDRFEVIVKAATRPVLAVGGIVSDVVHDVLERGAHGVAVISAINNSSDPRLAARQLRTRIDFYEEQRMELNELHLQSLVTINGKDVALAEGTTISAFLATKGLTERMVVVELNGTVLARSSFGSTVLRDGDRVEMVHAVGGG